MKKRTATRKATRHAGVKRASNGSWVIQASKRDGLGKRHYRRVELPGSMAIEDVVVARAKLVRDLAASLKVWTPIRPESTTLADFAERWIAVKAKGEEVNAQEEVGGLRRATVDGYIDAIGRRLLPALGHLLIVDIGRPQVVAWRNSLKQMRKLDGKHYSSGTIHNWWRPCTQLLRDAAAEFGVADPTLRLRCPKTSVRRVRDQRTLTSAELASLLDAVRREHPGWYNEIFVMAFSGMRPGELYALTWSDIDEARGVIAIERAHYKGDVNATKTDDPREAALTSQLSEVLKAQRVALLREQHPGLELGLVFPARHGGHRGPEALLGVLGRCSKAAGLDIKVGSQVLRRTFNTLAVEANVPREVLRAQVGHVSQAMTDRYSGIHAERKQSMVDLLHRAVEES